MITNAKTAAKPAAGSTKPSPLEGIKAESRQLRGTISESLAGDSDHFSDQDKQLLKFHGTYQQEDRDARKNRSKEGGGKHHMFMVRCRIPGGRLTAEQYLAVDDLASAYANATLRFTTRQGIQFHGVLIKNLKSTIAGINDCLLTTLGACGDVERNVMACPAPHAQTGVRAQLQETAMILAAHLAPRTRAYHEIWLDGEPVGDRRSADAEVEPLYGKVYLPRKFKTGLALPEDNCIDVYSQDLGLLAIVENGTVRGYNILAGGGMGMTHGNENTFPHLAEPICYVPATAVVGAAEAVVRLFRDHGNRGDRKRARIKYIVHDWGVAKFRQVLTDYIGGELRAPVPIEVGGFEPHLGWQPQGNGRWYYGISVENGRVKDEGSFQLRSALRRLIERLKPDIRLTPLQDILLCDLDGSARDEIERTLGDFGIRRPDQLSAVQKLSMACPALPTCGLALSESERALPGIIDALEIELKRLGLESEKLTVRMTGCPNGCARPYQSDIGIVGRSGDKYSLFVGGHVFGHRLNFLLRDLVPREHIVPTLVDLLIDFKRGRLQGESFGDYCHRLGAGKLQMILTQAEASRATADEAVGFMADSTGNGAGNGATSRLTPAADAVDVHVEPVARAKNGNGHVATPAPHTGKDRSELERPHTQSIPLALAPPEVSKASPAEAAKSREDFFVGERGDELRDYTVAYETDGSVRSTIVYYYGGDRRACEAHRGLPICRKAYYRGRVNPARLHSARKLKDIFYSGPPGRERKDREIRYDADGKLARTMVLYYEGGLQAEKSHSGSPLRRVVTYTAENEIVAKHSSHRI
jgi:sulfite reductase (ferredoxin)